MIFSSFFVYIKILYLILYKVYKCIFVLLLLKVLNNIDNNYYKNKRKMFNIENEITLFFKSYHLI